MRQSILHHYNQAFTSSTLAAMGGTDRQASSGVGQCTDLVVSSSRVSAAAVCECGRRRRSGDHHPASSAAEGSRGGERRGVRARVERARDVGMGGGRQRTRGGRIRRGARAESDFLHGVTLEPKREHHLPQEEADAAVFARR
eukprot:3205394-Prymnesium_polylepis.4